MVSSPPTPLSLRRHSNGSALASPTSPGSTTASTSSPSASAVATMPGSPSQQPSSAAEAAGPPPASETVTLALSTTPVQTKNARRDLTTSYRAFKQAWGAIEKTTVFQHSARRVGERAAQVLLVTTDKLQAYEPKDERAKILIKKVPYEFDAQVNPQETMFKLQSVMIDLQVAMTGLASPQQDRQMLLVRDLPTTVQGLAKLNASLAGLVELYELFISTESWALEDENDLATDYAALPRLFQLAFALRGPLYTSFLKEHPAPPGEIISISKRRDDYLAWCLDNNPLLRRDSSSPTTPKKRWAPPVLPDGSPNSPTPVRNAWTPGLGRPSGPIPPVPTSSGSAFVPSTTSPSAASDLRRSKSSGTRARSGTMSAPPDPLKVVSKFPVGSDLPRPMSPTPGPDTPPSPRSIPGPPSPGSPRPTVTVTPETTPPATPTKNASPTPTKDDFKPGSAEEITSESDGEGEGSVRAHAKTSSSSSSGSEAESLVDARHRELPLLEHILPQLDLSDDLLSGEPKALEVLDFDSLTPSSTDEPQQSLPTPLRAPRRSPSTPALPAIPEDDLFRSEPQVPVFVLRPATPINSTEPGQGSAALPRRLRILSLDGGGIRGLPLLYSLKSKLPKDSPPPCQIFDLIAGCGTGGLVAILLGRLRLSIDDATDIYISIAKTSFMAKEIVRKKSRWGRLFGGGATNDAAEAGKLVPGTRDFGLDEATLKFLPDALMLDPSSSNSKCKTAILAYEQSSYGGDGSPVWLRSYGDANVGSHSIRSAVRATMASSVFYRSYQNSPEHVPFIVAPESLNPADLTIDEGRRIVESADHPDIDEVAKLEIEQFLSIGVGQVPPGIRLSSKTKTRSLKLVTRIVDDNRTAYDKVLRRAKREGWSERIERVDVDLIGRDDKGIDEWVYHILLRDAIEEQVRNGKKSGSGPRSEGGAELDFAPTANGSVKSRSASNRATFSFRKSRSGPPTAEFERPTLRKSVSLTQLRSETQPMYLQREGSTASLDTDQQVGSWRVGGI